MKKAWEYGTIGVAAICYNEALLIKAWIDHLMESRHVEVLSLVDCGSTDGTIDIIEEAQHKYRERIVLEKVGWDRNFARLRNQSLIPLREKNLTWVLWADIDTFFNKNLDVILTRLNSLPLFMYNDIRIPSIRFWSLDKIMGYPVPICQHWGIIRLSALSGFVGNLHEIPLIPEQKILNFSNFHAKDVWLGHYDLAKMNALARKEGITLEKLMGRKKKRYLEIRKLTNSLSLYDPDPDTLKEEDLETFGKVKVDEELAASPLVDCNPEFHSPYVISCLK